MSVRFLSSGDTALTVEFGDRVDRALNDRVLRLSAAVRASTIPGIVETVPTYRSLLIHYDPMATDGESVQTAIGKLLDATIDASRVARLWRIPACYAESHAPDLAEVAQRTGLTPDEVVRLHSGTTFYVYMIGFSPGFAYMGDVPRQLALPRRVNPRVKVPAGSIAIATGMTAIYPVESPGGWHLIGSTPVSLFDVAASPPSLLNPGDQVRFEPIDASGFDAIRAAFAAGTFEVACETVAS